jgi:hypothetical protein
LPLLVTRVVAKDAHDALAAHDLALIANLLDAGPNLHHEPLESIPSLNASSGGVERGDFHGDVISR